MGADFNARLYALAKEDAERNRIKEDGAAGSVGKKAHAFSHMRHNFLVDCIDPLIPVFVEMVRESIVEFLYASFGYLHEGDMHLMSDTFLQRRSAGENIGIYTHTHPSHEIICTYYPRADDEDTTDNPFRKGALRFYNPAMRGNRLWPHPRRDVYNGSVFSVEPKVGSMVVFEGHMPHDSTFFEGEERMCIPVLCRLDLPNKHISASIKEILEIQNGV
jgi:hypothetical protein